MTGLSSGAPTFLSGSTLAFIVLGSVLEGIPAIILFGQLLFPIAHQVGNHEVHYAMVVVLAMGVGLFAPPFGVGYYRRLRDQRHQPRRTHEADRRLRHRLACRPDPSRRDPLDLHRLSLR